MGAVTSKKRARGRPDLPPIRVRACDEEDVLELFDCEEDGEDCEQMATAIRPFAQSTAPLCGSKVHSSAPT